MGNKNDLAAIACYLQGLIDGGYHPEVSGPWEVPMFLRATVERALAAAMREVREIPQAWDEERASEPFARWGLWHWAVNRLQYQLSETRQEIGRTGGEPVAHGLPFGDWSFAAFMDVAAGYRMRWSPGRPQPWWRRMSGGGA